MTICRSGRVRRKIEVGLAQPLERLVVAFRTRRRRPIQTMVAGIKKAHPQMRLLKFLRKRSGFSAQTEHQRQQTAPAAQAQSRWLGNLNNLHRGELRTRRGTRENGIKSNEINESGRDRVA